MASKLTVLFKPALLLMAVGILYFPIFKYGFFQDDFLHLINTQIPFTGLARFFTDNSAIYYRPLGLQLMYWWQQQAFGANPFYFHLVSLAIHLINTFLVYKLVARVTKN